MPDDPRPSAGQGQPEPANGRTEPDAVNPDELMSGVRRHSFLALVLVSLVVHVIAIFGTSLGYIRLMRQYKSWHPRIAKKLLEKQRREEESEAKRKAAQEKFLADQAKAKAAREKAGEKEGEKADHKDTAPAKGAAGDKPKILKEIEAKSAERPKESSLKLNELDSP